MQLNWKKLAKLVAESTSKIELDFSIAEELKYAGVSEQQFWQQVEFYTRKEKDECQTTQTT